MGRFEAIGSIGLQVGAQLRQYTWVAFHQAWLLLSNGSAAQARTPVWQQGLAVATRASARRHSASGTRAPLWVAWRYSHSVPPALWIGSCGLLEPQAQPVPIAVSLKPRLAGIRS